MSLSMGLQLFSVRDELAKDYFSTLKKIADIGYENLEFFIHDADKEMKIEGLEAKDLKNRLDELGLKAISMHVSPLTDEIIEEAITYNLELGSGGIGCSIAFFSNKQEVLDFSKTLNKYGQMCKEKGLDFYYHNHFQEFQKFDGEYVLDIILENTDPELVKLEFDTYWTLRGGVDPVDYLKKVKERCKIIHQKDMPSSTNPVNAFESLDENAVIDFDAFIPFSQPEYFTEIGDGMMDIPEIIKTAQEIGSAKYILVEQDLTTRSQLESIEISYKNLKNMLNE
ncbi:sugar phosphate isomerase/epimerase family protein [Oceanobacillus locisalsi]|uniref:Sugar phosphate isomerase/epimerase family protein n=1 Tax=Oceanobacillus locisalsi TaxID=546107 RepID=A0ABW3NBD3_9BACI